mmetsp:Transcript_7911/g.11911  ORF Transcript_7911/g.11911 Transcript_7911/m.11911 type:complete len:265 (+) Transcript_7911:91-885(+)
MAQTQLLPSASQVKSLLESLSLGSYWKDLSENGCDSIADIGISDVSTLVNVIGMSMADAGKLVSAARRFCPNVPSIEDVMNEKAAAEDEDEDEDEDENGVDFGDSKRGTKRQRPGSLLNDGGLSRMIKKDSETKLDANMRAEQESISPGERRRLDYGLANYHPEAIVAILRAHMAKSVDGLQDVARIFPANVMPGPVSVEPNFRYVTLNALPSASHVIPNPLANAAGLPSAVLVPPMPQTPMVPNPVAMQVTDQTSEQNGSVKQ